MVRMCAKPTPFPFILGSAKSKTGSYHASISHALLMPPSCCLHTCGHLRMGLIPPLTSMLQLANCQIVLCVVSRLALELSKWCCCTWCKLGAGGGGVEHSLLVLLVYSESPEQVCCLSPCIRNKTNQTVEVEQKPSSSITVACVGHGFALHAGSVLLFYTVVHKTQVGRLERRSLGW